VTGKLRTFLADQGAILDAIRDEHADGAYQRQRHCQTNQSEPEKGAGLRRSGRQLTPLGQGGRTVLLEDIATVEVTVVVEVVVDRGMGSGKLLESLHAPELRHRSFSSSERLV
jgi:hypothetical protein